ncbi:hypothetical protein Clacol_002400 [Clathrus columnatus]|uniref:Uncharacterized protein n=1 Tax=Clathrus columnatus TaxID=1419009 RepID=A0AAV5A0N0_9AGAM|nr:hypothetical protein Clacol_002400 [Clathrus columnatus]
MTLESHNLFRAVVAADSTAFREILASGIDVNTVDELGRSVLHYAALGPAINALESQGQVRLSEARLEVLRLISQHDQLSLYSLNAPMAWAGGVTLLGLMSWLNMSMEITYLLEFARGLLEVNAMDEQGATALMYAARDGNMQVVQRLLAHGARPDVKDISQKSSIQYAMAHPEVLWLCEETLRKTRRTELEISMTMQPRKRKLRPNTPFPDLPVERLSNALFYSGKKNLLSPPALNMVAIRREFDNLVQAIRNQDTSGVDKIFSGLHDSRSQEAPVLVNFRDEAGLAPIHHACSHRYSPSIEIADALYFAGADMGLYSTLGFTPLHHLARTARDAKKESRDGDSSPNLIQMVEDDPLYVFTVHLIRDLHASLRAIDNRGETPLHAAAEHGRSVAVLKAMLECDKAYVGKESVRETRNERGLRPVDVAKTEFIPIFMGELRDSLKKPPRPPPLKVSSSFKDAGPSPHNTPRSPRSMSSFTLVKKASDMSIMSKSSGSSSKSSGNQSQSSYMSQRSAVRHWNRPSHPNGMQPNPYPTPPSSYSGSPASSSEHMSGSFDAPACAMDVLYNLSLSASALQVYSQPHQEEGNNVPDLVTISETLAISRDRAMHVLDHWSSQLEAARSEYVQVKSQIQKAESLLNRVTKDVEFAIIRPHKREQLLRSLQESKASTVTESNIKPVSNDPSALESGVPGSLETVDGHSSHAQSVTVTSKGGRLRFDLSTYVEHGSSKPPSNVQFASDDEPKRRHHRHYVKETSAILKMAPKILQRANTDIHSIEANLLSTGKLFQYAEEAILEAHVLVDEAIKLREDQLSVVLRAHHGFDYFLHQSRLSPIFEKSSEGGHTSPSSTSTVTDIHSLSIPNLKPIEEPHILRHLLMRKIDRDVQRIIEDIQKTHVWLRVIREVLRGLRRRVFIEL